MGFGKNTMRLWDTLHSGWLQGNSDHLRFNMHLNPSTQVLFAFCPHWNAATVASVRSRDLISLPSSAVSWSSKTGKHLTRNLSSHWSHKRNDAALQWNLSNSSNHASFLFFLTVLTALLFFWHTPCVSLTRRSTSATDKLALCSCLDHIKTFYIFTAGRFVELKMITKCSALYYHWKAQKERYWFYPAIFWETVKQTPLPCKFATLDKVKHKSESMWYLWSMQ